MNTEQTEDKLRQLFSELSAEDSRRAPSFGAIMQGLRSATSTPQGSSPWLRFAAGTAAVVLLIAALAPAAFRWRADSFKRQMQQWAALSDWGAPTDALLSVSDMPWGGTVAAPSDFLIKTTTESRDTTGENP